MYIYEIKLIRMGLHKNNAQIEIFLKFMEQHTDMAKGFVKGDRVHFDQLWADLASELNASGPPTKEVTGWKKVWTDMKLSVKQRLAHNKVEVGKTGGGRYNKYVISPTEEQIALICGLYASVNGVESAKSYGVPKKNLPTASQATLKSPSSQVKLTSATAQCTTNAQCTTTCTDEILTDSPLEFSDVEIPGSNFLTPTISTPLKIQKRKRQVADIEDVLQMEAEHFTKISDSLERMKEETKESNKYLKELSKNLRELRILKEKELKETIRHNYVVEKSMKTRNEIKLKFLELEQMKLDVKPQSN